jgi:HEAT repeat protein
MVDRMLNRLKLMFYVWRLRSKRSATSAAFQLGLLGDRRAVAPLITVLETDHGSLGGQVADTLGVLGDCRAVGALVKALTAAAEGGRGGDDFVCHVVGALIRLRDPEAVEPLIQALETTDNRYIKVRCCFALCALGDRAAIGALLRQHIKAKEVLKIVDEHDVGLNDVIRNGQESETDVRRAAAFALQELGHPDFVGLCQLCGGYGRVLRRSRRGVTDAMGLHGHVEHTEKEKCRRCLGSGRIMPQGPAERPVWKLPEFLG